MVWPGAPADPGNTPARIDSTHGIAGWIGESLLQRGNRLREPEAPDAAGRWEPVGFPAQSCWVRGTGQPAPTQGVIALCVSEASDQEVSLTSLCDLPESIPSPSQGSIYILAKH